MKNIILSFILVGTLFFTQSAKAQAPFLDDWGWQTGSTYLVFQGELDTSSRLPVGIVITIFQTDTFGSDSTTGFWTSGVFHQIDYNYFRDTVFGLPANAAFEMHISLQNDSGMQLKNLYCYTSYPTGIATESADAPNIWNPQGTKAIKYSDIPENSTMIITNIIGQSVMSSEISDQSGQVDVNQLQAGIYFATLWRNGEVLATKKILIE